MTVDNVTQVIDKIEGDKWEMMDRVGVDIVPHHQVEEIKRRYFTDTEKTHACVLYNSYTTVTMHGFIVKTPWLRWYNY